MGILINDTDFVEKFAVAKTKYSNLVGYIDLYEKKYLELIFGVELSKLFIENVDTVTQEPTNPIYLNIYKAISEDNGKCINQSYGLKNVLLALISFEFNWDLKFKPTQSGTVVNQTELNEHTIFEQTNFYTIYNEAVRSIEVIQNYIKKNKTDYPTYNGQCFAPLFWV